MHLALMACLLSAADVETGTFIKAPGANVVAHHLGAAPKAPVVWTVYAPGQTRAGYQAAVGLSDGTESYSVAASSQSGVAPSVATRRIASQLLTVAGFDGGTLAEGALTDANAASFTITWSPDDGAPAVIHYLLVGGAQTVAKVVTWNMPEDAGAVAVSTGFRPDAVLFLASGASTRSIPANDVVAHLTFGAADGHGRQWVGAFESLDSTDPSSTGAYQASDACIAVGVAPYVIGRVAAFDDAGFSVDFPLTLSGGGGIVISLALAGFDAEAGSFAPDETAHVAAGTVLLSTTSSSSPAWALGAVSPTAQHGAALADAESVSPTRVAATDSAVAALPLLGGTGSALLDGGSLGVAWSPPLDAGAPVLYFALTARDDAGARPDAGAAPSMLRVGCGCASSGSALPLVLLLLAIGKAFGTSPPTRSRGRPPRSGGSGATSGRNLCRDALDRALL